MPYPTDCFTNLVALRDACAAPTTAPQFWLNDIPGLDLQRLADIANAEVKSGSNLGVQLIESAARFVATDLEAIYDGKYKVVNTLVTGCSNCTFTANTASGPERGTLVKNTSASQLARLVVPSFTAKVLATGAFTIVLNDGLGQVRQIAHSFVNGEEYEFRGVNFETRSAQVRLYLLEQQPLAQLSCATSSGCSCTGSTTAVGDISYTGWSAAGEVAQAYGFSACAFIRCDAADLLCYVAQSAPRMVGVALLYKTAALYFTTAELSQRNNPTAGINPEQKNEQAEYYEKLYLNQLNGVGTRGLKDLVATTLGQFSDKCVVCDSAIRIAWAGG